VFDLGAKSIFTMDSLFGKDKDEVAKFEREPPRVSLTEPPVGYRTSVCTSESSDARPFASMNGPAAADPAHPAVALSL